MGENLDPLITDSGVKPISHRGILVVMAAVAIAGALLGFVLQGTRFGVGILFGGVLAFINYLWLERSTRAIFENTAISSAGWLAAKYILRYVAIGAVLLLIYLTSVLPVTAVIAGLAAFAVAVMIRGLMNIFKS
ncbi:MAG: ATP synthase subunit I [Pyrinomonadaceae bacterium]